MANYKNKRCIICDGIFKPTSSKQNTCLNKECKNEARRRAGRKRYKSRQTTYTRECLACKIKFTTSDSRRIYCGSVECERVRLRRKNNKPKVVPYHKSRKTLQEVKDYFSSFDYTVLSDSYINNHTKLKYRCPRGHINGMTYANFSSGKRRCPECYGNKIHSIEYVREYFKKEEYTLVADVYLGGYSRLEYTCPNGHKDSMCWNNFRSGKRCPVCQNIRKITVEVIEKTFKDAGYKIVSEVSDGSSQYIDYMCPKGHFNTMLWGNFNANKRCPDCAENKVLTIEHVKRYFESRGHTLLSTEYKNSHTKLEYECKAGHLGTITYNNFHGGGKGCPKCAIKRTKSKPEEELYNFVCSLIGEENVIGNDRGLISPLELDIFVPEKKLAIEYCGLHWHGEESGKKSDYHYNKMKACNDLGVRLITIFEDEYKDKPEVVLSRVRNALGVGLQRIFARKCKVKEISTKESKEFLLDNHLQGTTGAMIKWGLFYQGELVQVLTAGLMSRAHTGKLKGRPDAKLVELKRFASKEGVSIVGGASKLFKRLKGYAKGNGFTHVKSYCDTRYANISPVYERLGFELLTLTKYTPHYAKGGKRYRNQGLRKTPAERLTGLTEWELRKAQGYDRIYDTGHKTYIYEI